MIVLLFNTFSSSLFLHCLLRYLSESAYHVGDEVLVQWFYDGTGEKFQIELLKEGNMVADLCASEEEGLCFDLTHDQTVLLPSAE